MTNETSSNIDWKEIGITAAISLLTTAVAVVIAQTLILPAINKAKEKRAASKDKEAKK